MSILDRVIWIQHTKFMFKNHTLHNLYGFQLTTQDKMLKIVKMSKLFNRLFNYHQAYKIHSPFVGGGVLVTTFHLHTMIKVFI